VRGDLPHGSSAREDPGGAFRPDGRRESKRTTGSTSRDPSV